MRVDKSGEVSLKLNDTRIIPVTLVNGSASKLIEELQSIDPLKHPDELYSIIWEYLKPRGGVAPRAHLFTINGLTYPLHRDFGFAAVPDPHEVKKDRQGRLKFDTNRSKRRYSMLAYLYSVRPGDLIFFFQADPQWPEDIWNRRGFRGIWVAKSRPFRDKTTITHPETKYEILGECPQCHTPFNFGVEGELKRRTRGSKSKRCPICGKEYGFIPVRTYMGTREYSRVVLSARILIEPVIVFKRTSGDNRVYSDMTVEPFIWISRTDNAMGPGKGSSIRTLMPEEAAKISFMLATEDAQSIENVEPKDYPGDTSAPIDDYNEQPATYLRARDVRGVLVLEHEFHLNLYFAMNIDNPNSPIQRELRIPLNSTDYWTTEFPWGYTGDTSDFVLTLWDDDKGRHTIYLFEFKKDMVDKKALAETLLYVPWVTQVLTQFRPETTEIKVYPVIVGKYIQLRFVPESYEYKIRYFTTGITKKIIVESPIIVQYTIKRAKSLQDKAGRGAIYYVEELDLKRIDLKTKPFKPLPPIFTTTGVEKEFVVRRYLSGF